MRDHETSAGSISTGGLSFIEHVIALTPIAVMLAFGFGVIGAVFGVVGWLANLRTMSSDQPGLIKVTVFCLSIALAWIAQPLLRLFLPAGF
jgi:hypothetical protein